MNICSYVNNNIPSFKAYHIFSFLSSVIFNLLNSLRVWYKVIKLDKEVVRQAFRALFKGMKTDRLSVGLPLGEQVFVVKIYNLYLGKPLCIFRAVGGGRTLVYCPMNV